MLERNSDLRSTPYQNYSPAYLATLEAQQQRSRWRLGYHIQPRSGLINDPNGFAYFANQWHLFKQQFPFGPVHGLKSWGHLTSNNLAYWQDQGTALHPHSPYTTNGVYSGSALPVKDRLFMMYTGNVRTADGGRRTTQLGAWMDQSGDITEMAEPLIAKPPAGYTSHFRDPQLIEHNGTYYALIGAQRADKKGQILLYTAAAPTGPWQLIGPLDFGRTTLGEMIECPNLAFVDGQVALLFCPQGMAQRDCAYQNVYPNTVVVAAGIDWQNASLIVPGPLRLLDEGFDAYAGHVVNEPNGDALMIAWMGLPDLSYPSDEEGWQGCYSLVRRLRIRNGRLYQVPIDGPLLGPPFAPLHDKLNLQEVITLTTAAHRSGQIRLGNAQESLSFTIDAAAQALTIDRTETGVPFALQHGTTRTVPLPAGPQRLQLWLDHSSFELSVANGQHFASGRIFPQVSAPWHMTADAGLVMAATGHRLNNMS